MRTKRSTNGKTAVVASLFLAAALLGWATVSAAADVWPEKPVELINPFAAGAAADIQARKLAELISRDLGQPMVVRNVTGAGGSIAYNEVNRSKPDGHTLIWYSGAINTLAARKQIQYDYTAFVPIAGSGSRPSASPSPRTPPGRISRSSSPTPRQNPGKVTIGQLRDGQRHPHGARGDGLQGRAAGHPRPLRDRGRRGVADGREDPGLQPAPRGGLEPGESRRSPHPGRQQREDGSTSGPTSRR